MLGPWWGPTKPFCGYVNEDRVGTVLPGGGTHKHYMWSSKYFPPQVVGTLKPSIEMLLLPLLSVCSLCCPSLPWSFPDPALQGVGIILLLSLLPFAPFPSPLLPELPWSFPDPAPQVVGTIQPSIEIPPIGPYLLPSPKFLACGGDLWSPFVAMWMEFGGAKGEQTGSLNRVFFTDLRPFSRIRGLFRDSGPFRGFGAFFGDLGPFSGIRGLFWGFTAFSGIQGLFWGFTAFSGISGLFADSRIHSQGSEWATWRNFRYLIFGCFSFLVSASFYFFGGFKCRCESVVSSRTHMPSYMDTCNVSHVAGANPRRGVAPAVDGKGTMGPILRL